VTSLQDQVAALVADWTELTDEQLDRVAALLSGVTR